MKLAGNDVCRGTIASSDLGLEKDLRKKLQQDVRFFINNQLASPMLFFLVDSCVFLIRRDVCAGIERGFCAASAN